MTIIPPVDLNLLRDNSMGDDSFIGMMAEMFVTQTATELERLTSLCQSGPNTECVETAHSLKGAAAMMGAEDMRQLCAEAQKMADASAADRTAIAIAIHEKRNICCEFLERQGLYSPASSTPPG